MPAEWEPHERCLLAWPGEDLVSTRLLTAAKLDYALVARAISEFEPVLVLARPGFGPEVAAACGPRVDVAEVPFAAAWIRDSGPIFARRNGTEIVAVDFEFNGWGSTLPASAHGETAGASVAALLGVERVAVPLVLEGGAVTTDGEGTLIAVEATILNENRNPGV